MACDECQTSGCGYTCWEDSSSCENCGYACSQECGYCGGCGDDCGYDCGYACTKGCGGCDYTCGWCDYGCLGTCTYGCKDTCKNGCTDDCNNGCTGQNVTDVYRRLESALHDLILASDVNDLKTIAYNEVDRRNKSHIATDDAVKGQKLYVDIIDNIYDNLKLAGVGEISEEGSMPDKDNVNNYITAAKALYNVCFPAK